MAYQYKLLVIDIDGTLLNINRLISAENKAAVARVRQAGMQVSLSTGRAINACRGVLEQLEMDSYHISFDGALVSSPSEGKEVYARPLERSLAGEMVDYAHDRDIELELYSAERYFTEGETWSTGAHREFFGVEPTITDFNRLWREERIIKGGLITTTPESDTRAREFHRRFADRLHFSWARTPAYPGVNFINVLTNGVSKGKALEELASHQGVGLHEIVAVGDGSNDISLLSAAGLAIAMGNALDEVKAVADHVTLDVDHNGLAAAINELLV